MNLKEIENLHPFAFLNQIERQLQEGTVQNNNVGSTGTADKTGTEKHISLIQSAFVLQELSKNYKERATTFLQKADAAHQASAQITKILLKIDKLPWNTRTIEGSTKTEKFITLPQALTISLPGTLDPKTYEVHAPNPSTYTIAAGDYTTSQLQGILTDVRQIQSDYADQANSFMNKVDECTRKVDNFTKHAKQFLSIYDEMMSSILQKI